MNLRTLALGLAVAFSLAAPAEAQRGGGRGAWELLGEERVGFGADRDVIKIGHNEDYYRGRAFRQLRFVAEGGEVKMRSIRLHYLNGHSEEVAFDRTLRPGQEVDVDLRGERSYLRQIEMFYKAKFGISLGGGGIRVNQASIKVFGENVRGGPPPAPVRPGPVGGGFDEIARERFNRADRQVDIRVGRREGRFGQIRLRNTSGDAIDLREVDVRFSNGETQRVRMTERLDGGELTSPIDLEGDQRSVERVTVQLNPRRNPGPAEIALLATQRPGRDNDDRPGPGAGPGFRPRPEWVPLGRQEVGFRVDRDVIRVGQNEDFFRNRGFDRLHFVAEGNEIHLMGIRVVYLNGHGEDVRIDRLIRAGTDVAIDLPGRRSYIREIELVYRARPGFGGRATMSVFGEPSSRR